MLSSLAGLVGAVPGIDVGGNVWARYFLGFAAFEYVFSRVSDMLNLSAMTKELPAEFESTYDGAAYAKSQEYTRAKTKFKTWSETYSVVQYLAMWYCGVPNLIDLYIRDTVPVSMGYEAITYGISFFLAQTVLGVVLGLPEKLYHTFVLEERFGFNKTTPATFVTDMVKELGVSAVLLPLVLAPLIYFFESMGDQAWLYCWGFTCAFMLIMQYLAPTFIMPLFNTFEALKDGELKDALTTLAKGQDFDFGGLYVMDGSRRSAHSNAFFTGFGASKRICLFDSLIEKQSVPEIVAILGHEIGHYKMKHIWMTTALAMAQAGAMFYLMKTVLTTPAVFAAFNIDHHSVYMGFMVFSSVYAPVSFVTGILMKMYSRKNEFEADRYSVDATRKPEDLISGLKSLSKNSLVNLTPHPFFEFVNYSHPSMVTRIRAIREYASKKKDL